MKLTVLHITSKGLYPFNDGLRDVGLYDILAESLRAQTFTPADGFEVVCVDASNTIPRTELTWWLKDRVRFVRPRETPWREAGAFCAASARNSGLVWARGETVISIDDCYELPPTFLERVADLAAQGLYAWPYIHPANGEQGAYAVEGPQPLGADEHSGGIVAYPLAAALACNGWPEWDGARHLEDWAFSEYLRVHGVRQVRDAGVYVVDPGRPQHIVGRGPRWITHRCPRALWALSAARGWQRANEPWTAAELAMMNPCAWRNATGCTYTALPSQCGGICEYPATPTVEAQRLMSEYEGGQWRNLIAERACNGLV